MFNWLVQLWHNRPKARMRRDLLECIELTKKVAANIDIIERVLKERGIIK